MASGTGRLRGAQSPARVALSISRPDIAVEEERMAERMVQVTALAKHVGVDRATVAAWVRRQGYEPTYVRCRTTGQRAQAISEDLAKRAIAEFKSDVEIVKPEDLFQA